MRLQKNNYYLILLVFVVLQGCASSHYRITQKNSNGTDIEVSSDRVITQCEFIDGYDGDRKDPYGFMIHILDLDKTVLTVSNGVVLEKDMCFESKALSDKIISSAKVVTVRGRGDAESSIIKGDYKYTFNNYGTYPDNGRSLNFLAIWNDQGLCFDAFYGTQKPCPREEP